MLSFVLVDIHVVKVSGIVLGHVHHAEGRINSRQAVPQPGPHPGKPLVADQVRDNLGTWSACHQVRPAQYFVVFVQSRRNDVVTIQSDKELMQLFAWTGCEIVQANSIEVGVVRCKFMFQLLLGFLDLRITMLYSMVYSMVYSTLYSMVYLCLHPSFTEPSAFNSWARAASTAFFTSRTVLSGQQSNPRSAIRKRPG